MPIQPWKRRPPGACGWPATGVPRRRERAASTVERGASTLERGASTVEWGGALLIVAAILGLLLVSVPGSVSTGVQSAVCRVFDVRCAAPGAQAGAPEAGTRPQGRKGIPPRRTQAPPPQRGTPPRTPARRSTQQTETERVLNETPLGREALEWARNNGVPFRFRRGGGSFYDEQSNQITVDSSTPAADRAAAIVHEVNHARNRGTPDPRSMTRTQYVNASINEEVDGVILEIRANQQLQQARAGTVQPPNVSMQTQYEAASYRAVQQENARRARAGQPALSAAEARRVGEAAGRRRVRQAFDSGEVVASTNGQTYRAFYGADWDANH